MSYVEERDQALLSLNRRKILAFMRKHSPGPETEALASAEQEVFWGSVHKARTGATSLPMSARSESKFWLAQRGWQSLDDGDVPWTVDGQGVICDNRDTPDE